MVALSVHYMPDLDGLKMDFLLYPDLNFCPEQNNEEGRRELARWREKAAAFGAENAVKGLVNGYCNAIRAHKKVRTLSHMYDGLLPLRTYTFDVDALGEKRCIELFEPLFAVMRDNEVRWELTGGAGCRGSGPRRADEMGVRFIATADAHFLDGGWGPFTHHDGAEAVIDRLGLRRARVSL